MLTSKISLYDTHTSKECKIQTVNDYVQQVKYGTAQDAVLQGRAAKQRGDIETYKKIKSQSICVTPTGFIESGKSKEKKNLTPNGLVCVDIDTELTEEQFHAIYCDQYSFIVHKSFGGEGICVFVKIDPSKLDDAYNAISKYYYDTYNIQTDKSCSNSNRLRYLSYDP